MNVNTAELEKTRLLILEDPSLLDEGKVGGDPIGLTLSRILGRPLTINDKHEIPALARLHLGLEEADFERLYRIYAWPDDLRLRWHEIPYRREMISHPDGHLANDGEERAARAEVVAELLHGFISDKQEEPKEIPFGERLTVTEELEAELLHHPGKTMRLNSESIFVRAIPRPDKARTRFVLCNAYGQILYVPTDKITLKQ